MSKPEQQPPILTWILAGSGVGFWVVGTMGWVPVGVFHPLSYVLLLIAAVTADRVVGRTSASNLQLGYTVVAWLMVALISVTEALPLGAMVFFAAIALTMTLMYFHPSFSLSTRVSLYLLLLMVVWAPALYGVVRPDDSDAYFGPGARNGLLVVALAVSALFFGFTIRWLTVRGGKTS